MQLYSTRLSQSSSSIGSKRQIYSTILQTGVLVLLCTTLYYDKIHIWNSLYQTKHLKTWFCCKTDFIVTFKIPANLQFLFKFCSLPFTHFNKISTKFSCSSNSSFWNSNVSSIQIVMYMCEFEGVWNENLQEKCETDLFASLTRYLFPVKIPVSYLVSSFSKFSEKLFFKRSWTKEQLRIVEDLKTHGFPG